MLKLFYCISRYVSAAGTINQRTLLIKAISRQECCKAFEDKFKGEVLWKVKEVSWDATGDMCLLDLEIDLLRSNYGH
jgi:hypothetical protein